MEAPRVQKKTPILALMRKNGRFPFFYAPAMKVLLDLISGRRVNEKGCPLLESSLFSFDLKNPTIP